MALALASWLHMAGCSMACQAGMLANFEAEVGPSLNPCTVGASGVGLPQYAGVRRRRLLATLGSAWCQPYQQLEFVVMELREMGLFARLFRASDPGEAARLFMIDFERPRRRDPRHRMRRAREIYRMLGTR